MPHDKNGVALRPGDRVIVEFTVRAVYSTAETCNVDLVRKRDGEQELYLTCQAKQTELVRVAE